MERGRLAADVVRLGAGHEPRGLGAPLVARVGRAGKRRRRHPLVGSGRHVLHVGGGLVVLVRRPAEARGAPPLRPNPPVPRTDPGPYESRRPPVRARPTTETRRPGTRRSVAEKTRLTGFPGGVGTVTVV